mgnify:CR=1 FL=1
MRSNKFNFFPTTVLEYDLTNHPSKEILLNYIDDPSNLESHGLVDKGVSNYHREYDFLRNPHFISLRNDFNKCLDDYCFNLGISYVTIMQSWFNILEKGGKVTRHNHGGSILSGAYYPLLQENTCNLYIKNPIQSTNIFHYQPYTELYQYEDKCIQVKENHVYIFPGWLEHYTETNKSDKRITISFNTKFY